MAGEFARDLEKRVIKMAESAVRDIAQQRTRDMAAMSRRLEGKPLDEIKAELARYYRRNDGEITEPELTEHAEQLQKGGKIVFEYGGTIR